MIYFRLTACPLLASIIVAISFLGLAYGHIDVSNETEANHQTTKRFGSCGYGELLLYGRGDSAVCMSAYVFASSLSFGIIGMGFFYGIASKWSQAVKAKAGFQDDNKPTRDLEDATSWPNWDELGVTPVENEDGTYSYDYNYSSVDDSSPLYKSASSDSQAEVPLEKFQARYHSDGSLLGLNVSTPLHMNNKRQLEGHSVTYSYGAPSGHRKTNLSGVELYGVFGHAIEKAIDNDPEISGFCARADNGGDWEGYIAIAIDDIWDDCWMYIQNSI